uniref:Uncharacterized protein n=2 Tax=Lotharella globosa TaxID=91324 RepID=A0A7S3Z6J0_9EUKA|mmetsp:Transcript_2916/g.5776  ORF Transcript_2916/g.5776 Transcript_2916/m.5776 type:complete len:488 (+) Transcript_2916:122-1585(+)
MTPLSHRCQMNLCGLRKIIEVDWQQLDGSFIQEFLKRQTKEVKGLKQQEVPDFANHCLIFWRGVFIRRESGFFRTEKIDLMVQRYWQLFEWLFRGQPMPKSPPVSPRYAKGRNVSQTATYLFNRVREGVFTRRTIRDDVKEKGFFSVFTKSHLEEVCLEEVVMISRTSQTKDLKIMRYNGLALADLVALLPLKVQSNWADYLMLFLTVALFASYAIGVFRNYMVIIPIVLSLTRRAALYGLRRNMAQQRAKAFLAGHQKQTTANQISEISHIAHASKEQQVMTLALAYTVLWMRGGRKINQCSEVGMTCYELMEECKTFCRVAKLSLLSIEPDICKTVRVLTKFGLARLEPKQKGAPKTTSQQNWSASARTAADLSPVREHSASSPEKKWSQSARSATDDAPVGQQGASSEESSPGGTVPFRVPPKVPELTTSVSAEQSAAGFSDSSTLSSPRTPRSMSGKLLQRKIYAVGLGQATANVYAVLKTLI